METTQKSNLTEKTLRWAQDHDWGRDAWLSSDGCIMIEHPEEGLLSFATYRELRTWAGY